MELKDIKTGFHIVFTFGFLIYFAFVWFKNGRKKPFEYLNIALAPNSFIAGIYLIILSLKYNFATPKIKEVESDMYLYSGIAGACMAVFGIIKVIQIYRDICAAPEIKIDEDQSTRSNSISKPEQQTSLDDRNKNLLN